MIFGLPTSGYGTGGVATWGFGGFGATQVTPADLVELVTSLLLPPPLSAAVELSASLLSEIAIEGADAALIELAVDLVTALQVVAAASAMPDAAPGLLADLGLSSDLSLSLTTAFSELETTVDLPGDENAATGLEIAPTLTTEVVASSLHSVIEVGGEDDEA